MGSKAFLLLGLLVALVLVHISSQVAARDLAETTVNKLNGETSTGTNGLDDAKHNGGYGGHPGGGGYGGNRGHGGYPGRGGYGGYPGRGGYGGYPGRGGYGGYPGRGGNGGGHCAYGCCGAGNYYGRGCRCCSYAGEAAEAKPQH